MTSDRNHDDRKKTSRQWLLIFVVVIALLGTIWLMMISSGPGGGWIEITATDIIRDIFRSHSQSRLNKRQTREVKRLEALGGARGSEGLLEIAFFAGTADLTRMEAFAALGRIGTPEITPSIIERSGWHNFFVPNFNDLVFTTLGEIGGETACQTLSHKFIDETEDFAYRYIGKPFSLGALVEAIRTGRCLGDEEFQARLRRFARDPWVTKKLLRPSLDLLAAEGDPGAVEMISRIEPRVNVLEFSLEEHTRLLKDNAIPGYIRMSYMDKLTKRTERKDQLLDSYLEVLVQWFTEMPNSVATEWNWMISNVYAYSSSLFFGRNSSWEGFHESAFQDWTRKAEESLGNDRLSLMLNFIGKLEKDSARARKTRAQLEPEGQ